MLLPLQLNGLNLDSGTAVAVVTGTLDGSTEADIVSGGQTIIITLTNDTWVAAGATFNAQRQNIIDGLDSAQSEATGWNNEVRDNEVVTSVVRTSDTVVTITLTAASSYAITADEVITVTVPATALTGAVELTAAPTLTITDTGKVVKGRFRQKRLYAVTIDGQDFVVSSVDQVERLLKEVSDLAEEQVEKDEPIQPPKIIVKTRTGQPSKAQGVLSAVRQAKTAVNNAIIKQQRRIQKARDIDREISELLVTKIDEEDEAILTLLLM